MSREVASRMRAAGMLLMLSCAAGCAADANELPTEADAREQAASSATSSAPGPATRWQVLHIGSRFSQRMTVQVDARGNVMEACAGGSKAGATWKP